MKNTIVLTSLLGLFVFSSTGILAQVADNMPTQKMTNAPNKIKWLGVSLTELSGAMHSHLGKLIETNEGVLIKNVQPGSPAEKAGLKAYDILTQFNDKKVSSTEQVYQLVQKASTNQNIPLSIIRGGEKQTISVKVGEREISNQQQNISSSQHRRRQLGVPQFNNQFWNAPNFDNSWNSPFFQPNWQRFSMPSFPTIPDNFPQGTKGKSWSHSESLSIKTLKNGNVRAEISTKDTDGNEKQFTFEDTRENVIKQIQQQKDLPDNQKQNLINSIQGNPMMGRGLNSFFNNGFFGNGMTMPQVPFNNNWRGFPQPNRPVY